MTTWIGRRRHVVACATTVIVVAVWVIRGRPGLPLAILLGLGAIAALAYVSFVPVPPVRSRRDPVASISYELERCRRHGRCCSLARLPGAATEACGDLRRADEVWAVGGDLLLMMPETTGVGAQLAVRRLVGDAMAAQVVVATFPEDALTVHRLLEALRAPSESEVAPLAPLDDRPVAEVEVEAG